MSRGVEARGSNWTPGVPRALGSFPGDADLLQHDGVPGAAKKQGGGALARLLKNYIGSAKVSDVCGFAAEM